MNSFLVNPGNNNLTDCSMGPCADWSTDPAQGSIFPVNNSTLASCSGDNPCNIFGVDQNLKTPYVMNWNVNLQHEILPQTLLQIAYVANRGRNLYSTLDINQPDQALSAQCVADQGGYYDADITGCESQHVL